MNLSRPGTNRAGSYGISPGFPGLSRTEGQVPTRYSPVRHSPHPEGCFPFDLHVLGLPPAFVLSQDQTLRFAIPDKSRPEEQNTVQTRPEPDASSRNGFVSKEKPW